MILRDVGSQFLCMYIPWYGTGNDKHDTNSVTILRRVDSLEFPYNMLIYRYRMFTSPVRVHVLFVSRDYWEISFALLGPCKL
ncbi:hypothetical protein HN51_009428 [Arachis hypogaea]